MVKARESARRRKRKLEKDKARDEDKFEADKVW